MHNFETGTLPDLRVAFLNRSKWQVALVSQRARGWFAAHDRDTNERDRATIEADVAQVNRLAASARQSGLRIEFKGPLSVMRL